MTEIVKVPTIAEVTPLDLEMRGIKLLGIDIENTLTNAGEMPLFPWALSAVNLLRQTTDLCLVTNAGDRDFALEVSEALELPLFAKEEWNGIRSKMHPDLYVNAVSAHGIRRDQMGMVDDQIKNLRGAAAAGIRAYFWTEAAGHIDHKGIKLSAALEKTVVRPAFGALETIRDIRRGDY